MLLDTLRALIRLPEVLWPVIATLCLPSTCLGHRLAHRDDRRLHVSVRTFHHGLLEPGQRNVTDSQLVNTQHERKMFMKSLIKNLIVEESGQDLIEYALLAGFISLVAVAAIGTVGTGVNGVYGDIATEVDQITPLP